MKFIEFQDGVKFDKVENFIVTDFVLNEALMILVKIAYEGRK